MFKHSNETVQRELNELYRVSRNKELSKTEKRRQVRILKQSLRNSGILSLPFSLNPKKILEGK